MYTILYMYIGIWIYVNVYIIFMCIYIYTIYRCVCKYMYVNVHACQRDRVDAVHPFMSIDPSTYRTIDLSIYLDK